jgi:hypothetical protein
MTSRHFLIRGYSPTQLWLRLDSVAGPMRLPSRGAGLGDRFTASPRDSAINRRKSGLTRFLKTNISPAAEATGTTGNTACESFLPSSPQISTIAAGSSWSPLPPWDPLLPGFFFARQAISESRRVLQSICNKRRAPAESRVSVAASAVHRAAPPPLTPEPPARRAASPLPSGVP